MQTIESNSVVFAGPFMGEFGWELTHWAPHVRWLRAQYKGKKIIAASYPGREPLYRGSINEFWQLPEDFVSKKYDCDCYEALSEDSHYEKLMVYFKEKLLKQYAPENIIWTKTPRGFNKVLRECNHVLYQKLAPSAEAEAVAEKMIADHGGKPVLILFARAVNRKMFLDIVHNAPRYVEDLPQGLPSRNWPRSHWEDLFDALYIRYSKQLTFAIGGTKGGNCLLSSAEKYPDVINLTEIPIEHSLDITIALLNKAFLSISSQSGPSHVSMQCGCSSFIYGHEMQRHMVDDNPLKSDVFFFETGFPGYNDPPEEVFKEVSAAINILMNEKGAVSKRIRKDKKIRKIGMVGVFENPNSTNIPFGRAFVRAGIVVETFNYRQVAAKIGIENMNAEIIQFAANYDLIIFCKGNGITPETIAACSRITQTLWYMMDAKSHLDHDKTYYDMAREATFNVATTGAVCDVLKEAGAQNVTHIIQGVDPKQFHPVEERKIYDVVFVGQKTVKRETVIDAIKKVGISVKCYGPGWGQEVYGEDFNHACAEGQILLAINNTDSGQDSFSDRILRYMATGGFVTTEYTMGLEKYFDIGSEIVCPRPEDSFVDLMQKYLADPETMERIAAAGRARVLKDYTWDAVAAKIIKIVEAKHEENNPIS